MQHADDGGCEQQEVQLPDDGVHEVIADGVKARTVRAEQGREQDAHGHREQTERVIDIIESILSEVDCTLADVAQTTVYLSSLKDMEAMNEVYARRFSTPAPARAVVGVSELPLGALIEMDCVACR